MMISVKIDPFEIYEESNCEIDLVPYMLKLRLRESGIPVVIDPLSIRSADLFLMHGELKVIIELSENDILLGYAWKE